MCDAIGRHVTRVHRQTHQFFRPPVRDSLPPLEGAGLHSGLPENQPIEQGLLPPGVYPTRAGLAPGSGRPCEPV